MPCEEKVRADGVGGGLRTARSRFITTPGHVGIAALIFVPVRAPVR